MFFNGLQMDSSSGATHPIFLPLNFGGFTSTTAKSNHNTNTQAFAPPSNFNFFQTSPRLPIPSQQYFSFDSLYAKTSPSFAKVGGGRGYFAPSATSSSSSSSSSSYNNNPFFEMYRPMQTTAHHQQQQPLLSCVLPPLTMTLPPPPPVVATSAASTRMVTIYTWPYTGDRVGDYDLPNRTARLKRYQEKRKKLKFRKVRYAARSEICSQRKRVGGRFVTSSTPLVAEEDKRCKVESDQFSSDEEVSSILRTLKNSNSSSPSLPEIATSPA